MNRTPFEIDGWYHCFTRGIDRRRTFQNVHDYRRFLQILYLANNIESVHRSNLGKDHAAIFSYPRGSALVAIGAYCIMPNHFHILVQEKKEGGIVKFMQKVGTSYAMYFNIRNQRVGNLFVKPFRSKYIDDDAYLRKVAQYIHLNPVELYDRDWKKGSPKPIRDIEKNMRSYEFSSLIDYENDKRPERTILDDEARAVMADGLPPLSVIIEEAAEYYREIGMVVHQE